jgi:hypothetical protein
LSLLVVFPFCRTCMLLPFLSIWVNLTVPISVCFYGLEVMDKSSQLACSVCPAVTFLVICVMRNCDKGEVIYEKPVFFALDLVSQISNSRVHCNHLASCGLCILMYFLPWAHQIHIPLQLFPVFHISPLFVLIFSLLQFFVHVLFLSSSSVSCISHDHCVLDICLFCQCWVCFYCQQHILKEVSMIGQKVKRFYVILLYSGIYTVEHPDDGHRSDQNM